MSFLLALWLSGPAWSGQEGVALVRGGDGGKGRLSAVADLEKGLARGGCGVTVKRVAFSAPTPAGTVLEFTPETLEAAARRLPHFKLLARALTIEGESRVAGAFLVKKSTGIDNLATLAGEPVAFVSPHSPSGYEAAVVLASGRGLSWSEGERFFSKSHTGAISMLIHGDVQAAVLAAPLARAWAPDNHLSIIAETPLLEAAGWWVGQGVDDRLARRCAQALVQISEEERRIFPEWIGSFRVEEPWTQAVP